MLQNNKKKQNKTKLDIKTNKTKQNLLDQFPSQSEKVAMGCVMISHKPCTSFHSFQSTNCAHHVAMGVFGIM